MPETSLCIRPFQIADEAAVIALWARCNLVRPWNNPQRDIQRKLRVQPELFLVGVLDDVVVASIMAGYEGHRGWINYLAVTPDYQRRGFGEQMLAGAEQRLRAYGCPKINLQVRATNRAVVAFYERLGYTKDETVSLGKRLEHDDL